MKPFSIIVAFDSQYGIGKQGQLPWHLPADLKHFKAISTAVLNAGKSNAVIMGRKTWESLPVKLRPLPGRVNLVLSRAAGLGLPSGVLCAQNLDDALSQLDRPEIENIFVIGGSQIFTVAMEHCLCHKLYVTHVQGKFECDVFFPPISKNFIPISSSEQQNQDSISFHFSLYSRH